ncbi:Cholesterol 7-alpha-monooxygenase 4 [Seiridium cupressi]
MSSQSPPDVDRALALTAAWWTEFAIASVLIFLRLWARRYKRALGLDDAFMVVAWLCFLGDAITIQFMARNGGTRHFQYLTPDQQEYQLMLVVVALDIGIAATGLGKVAIGFTILRIIGDTSKWQRWAVIFTITVTFLTGLVDLLLYTFRCGDPAVLWTLSRLATAQCLNENSVLYFNNFTNAWQVFNDFFFSLLPMAVVWRLRMPLRRKVLLIVGLGLTLVTGCAGAVKAAMTGSLTEDLTWSLFDALIWFGIESMLIIVCGSIPTLHPLWERFIKQPRQGYTSNQGSSGNYTDNSYKFKPARSIGPYSSVASRTHHVSPMNTSQVELTRLNPYQPEASAKAGAANHDGGEWLDGAERGKIHVRRDFEVISAVDMDHLFDGIPLSLVTAVVIVVSIASLRFILGPSKGKAPPHLHDPIPFLYNTIQLLAHGGTFLDRVKVALRASKSETVKFRVGFIPAYIVTGTQNVSKVLNSPGVLDGNFLQLTLMETLWGMTHTEINKFANDRSGRSPTPAPGTEDVPEGQRYWHGHDNLYVKYLSTRKYSDALASSFHRLFSERLDKECTSEWRTVHLLEYLKDTMAECAIISLFGSHIIELNPGFIMCYWQFDEVAGYLGLGLPAFFQRQGRRAKDRLHAMVRKHIDSAWESFDWDSADSESDWDPHFGSRLSRETAKWLREHGFSNHAAAGHTVGSLFGLNGNTVPITTWAMMELIQDPVLFTAVRKEAASAYTVDQQSGTRRIDAQTLINLPLMQSLYTEIMRMHISFNATRKALQSTAVGGYAVEKGALVQTPSEIAHYEEAVWGTEEHPASEFWAYRHIKYVNELDAQTNELHRQPQFSMKGRPSSFFPYGGGYVMCPGRHFAKQEILLAIAMMVTKLDFDFVDWVNQDGSRSVRPAKDNRKYAGFVAIPPDREMRVRWKRLS